MITPVTPAAVDADLAATDTCTLGDMLACAGALWLAALPVAGAIQTGSFPARPPRDPEGVEADPGVARRGRVDVNGTTEVDTGAEDTMAWALPVGQVVVPGFQVGIAAGLA